ncbi:hypothetical protein BpHYR1_021670 [Brachionus plicatilis]|uniref:Uncharacterized protein n=1 Tax=Brachionus plicatilis TaxID=10195 RepID=A0A3M7RUU5_BRAPC|nr:hypothetical protein BpHYR1_021670 [Brachionus plicatilis]
MRFFAMGVLFRIKKPTNQGRLNRFKRKYSVIWPFFILKFNLRKLEIKIGWQLKGEIRLSCMFIFKFTC